MPLNVVLAIDTSGSVRKDFDVEQQAAHRFVHALLRPVDRLDLMEFNDNVREVVGFTNSASRIDRGLNDIRGGAATALYSGVYLAAQTLAPYSGRKVLVLISDGGNTVNGTTYDMALEEAVRGEVMVYSIIDVPIYASAGRDLAGEHAMITLSEQPAGNITMPMLLRSIGPSNKSRRICVPNICWGTIPKPQRRRRVPPHLGQSEPLRPSGELHPPQSHRLLSFLRSVRARWRPARTAGRGFAAKPLYNVVR